MIKIEIKEGNLLDQLKTELEKNRIKDACICSVIGALSYAQVHNMDKNDAKKPVRRELNEPLEITGNGEVADGIPHVHCVLTRENGECIGGHLDAAQINEWFVNIYLTKKE